MVDQNLEAYCVKCKTNRIIAEPVATFTKNGRPATKGRCEVCGTTLFRMGKTDQHEGMETPKPEPKPAAKRKGKLVIVESPTKAKTVGRFLGRGYNVIASVGHVRDLLRSQLSVDVENGFMPKYRIPNEKRQVVRDIKKLAANAGEIYLATDPDREGEAIAWHLVESAEIPGENCHRVVFHEITEPAIIEAFSHSRSINMDLVDAQQARRILDRLVGYNLSPLLWRKVRGRLSAGRVQSVALRIVVEREREIEAFIPEEYWSIKAEFLPEDGEQSFIAKLVMINLENVEFKNESSVKPVLAAMEKAKYAISQLKVGERKRNPAAPFITSSLQQEASRKLGFTTKRTMALAQQLYEGIDLGEGSIGLITYMRTDSTKISIPAQEETRQFILNQFGSEYLPEVPVVHKTKTQGAQEAHEAIRPTSVLRQPDKLKNHLSKDQFRLYQMIWQRFVASQMSPAIYDTISVEVTGREGQNKYLLRSSGFTLRFSGFLIVYEESKEEDQVNGEDTRIPSGLFDGQMLELVQLLPEQHFTQPPPRYSEATLVRVLEENGIGRPSTYAPIIGTLQQRNYIVREGRKLFPTETGFIVNDLLIEHFPEILDIGFTAQMESDLDRIAEGEMPWVKVIKDFYEPFSEKVSKAEKEMPNLNMGPELVGRNCPECENELVIRWGRFGKFISCSNFPDCRYTEPWLEKINVTCPQDQGEIVERRTRNGRIFYGCANYPECDFTSWKRPLPQPCPNCNGLLVGANKQNAQCIKCEEIFPLEDFINEQVEVM